MALLGYARVSTFERDLALQLDALAAAGCERVFADSATRGRLQEIDTRYVRLDVERAPTKPKLWRVVRDYRPGGVSLVALRSYSWQQALRTGS